VADSAAGRPASELIWLGSKELNSVGDFFAGTVVLYDPNQLLHR
jgi:hypothetical protein